MAQHKSAEKRIRRNGRRQEINTARKSAMRTAVKKFEAAVQTGSADTVALISNAASTLQKSVSKGVMHKNTAARKLSRLVKKTKTQTAA